MDAIYALITHDFENEHDLEHDLEHIKPFSIPKIFDGDGDLKKRWYIYFSYRNPETGKLERMKNIYGKTNRFKTKAERYGALNIYRKRLLYFLNKGYNPFGDNTELHQRRMEKAKKVEEEKQGKVLEEKPEIKPVKETQRPEPKLKAKTIKIAFETALNLKTNVVAEKTLEDYKSRLNKLETWLKKNHKSIKTINQLNKKIIVEFLNITQLETSARNRNNYRTIFSSIFQLLEDSDVIAQNFIKHIKPLRTKPTRHKTYTESEQKAIFKHLAKEDPLLLLYIKFVAYNFIRPIEVCRLKVKDINIAEKTLSFKAKNKTLKTKIIPQILFDELPDLSKLNKEDFLFTSERIGGSWDATLINRRDHFSKRYGAVKRKLGFSNDYSLYSFRHTFITKLYRELAKDSSPNEAKSRLMQITGHSTMTALEKYLRDIDAELPKDYSDLL